MTLQSLADAFLAHRDKRVSVGLADEYCISVNAVPGLTLDEIASHAKRPNAMLRHSTVGAIRAAGFQIAETPGRRLVDGHCDVYLAGGRDHQPTDLHLVALQAAFDDDPIPNPFRR